MDVLFDERLAAVSVSGGADWGYGTLTNLATNPSFETGVAAWSAAVSTLVSSPEQFKFGTRSGKVTATGSSVQSGDIRAGSMTVFPFGMAAGKTYTLSAWIYTPAVHTTFSAATNSRQRRIIYFNSTDGSTFVEAFGPQAPNAVGWHLVTHTFTVPANATGVIVGIGCAGSPADTSFITYVDGISLTESPTYVPYFDGSTAVPADSPGIVYAWTGTAHASTSTRTIPAINRVEIEANSGQGWQQIRGGNITTGSGYYATADNEMPLHTTVQYRATGYNGTTKIREYTATIDTTVNECVSFIKKAGDPNATIKITQTGTVDITSQTQGGTYDIANGGSIAVAAYSGTNADRFAFTGITYSMQESRAMDALLSTRVLLFQPCGHEFYPAGWYFIESANKALREAPTLNAGHHWTLNLVRTAQPSGETAGVAGNSWARVRATYATWGDVLAGNSTWFDVLQGQ